MRRIRWILFIILISLTMSAPGYAEWARQYYGGGGSKSAYSAQQTADGGYVVAGWTKRPIYSMYEGTKDILVFKLNANGSFEWQNQYPSGAYINGDEGYWVDCDESANFIQQTADGGYIVAGWTDSYNRGNFVEDCDVNRGSEFWVLKLAADGNLQYQRRYGSTSGSVSNDLANSIKQTSDDGYIVAGWSKYGSRWDMRVIKLDTTLGVEEAVVVRLAVPNVVIYSSQAHSVEQTSDGGYVLAGSAPGRAYFPGPSLAAVIVRLDSSLSFINGVTYGGGVYDSARFIKQTADGGYIVAGWTESYGAGGRDVWVSKLDEDLGIEWSKAYGGAKFDEAYAVLETSDDNFIVAGATKSFGAGNKDIWILKLASNGNVVRERTYGGGCSDRAYSIEQTSGGYVVAGRSKNDIWVLKLDANGEIPGCKFMGQSTATVTNVNPGTGLSPATEFYVTDSAVYDWGTYTWDNYSAVKTRDISSRPFICDLKPYYAYPTENIRIFGGGFGDGQAGDNSVHIGNKTIDSSSSKIKFWSDGRIRVRTPSRSCKWFEGKSFKKQKVQVTAEGTNSTNKTLTVEEPSTCW
jgi:hypothetical protein